MKLSEHFTLEEFCSSATLDSYNECAGVTECIDNIPSSAAIEWMRYLCVNVLEPLREKLGKPIYINSGYRCPFLNTLVGGAKKSLHMNGQAADLRITDIETADEIFSILQNNKFVNTALFEKNSKGSMWIHVSVAVSPQHFYMDRHRCGFTFP